MTKKIYFENTPKYGDLYIDYIFHYDDQPILFSLKDKFSNLYLCVCYELREYQKWFIAKVDFNDLKQMNDNKKTVLELFLKNDSLLQAQRKSFTKKINYTFETTKEIDQDLLPEKGFYLETDNEEQEEFNEFYAKEIQEAGCYSYIIKEKFAQPIHIRKKIKIHLSKRKLLEKDACTYNYSFNNALINSSKRKSGGVLHGF